MRRVIGVGVIICRNVKRDRQNSVRKRVKKTNNDLQNNYTEN